MRARDADRNEVVEALEAAFVDGQLTADEREQRVAAALSAVELDDLRPLVRDLQNAPEQFRPGVVQTVRAAAVATPPRRYLLAGLAVTAVIAAPFVIAALADNDSASFSSTSSPEQDELVTHSNSFVVMWSKVKDELRSGQPANQREGKVPSLEPWEVNAEKVELLFEVIHNQFDAPYLTELALRPDSFSFTRPLKGTQPRTEDWSYYKSSGVSAREPEKESGRDMPLFDTRDIDVPALFRNLDSALQTLEVSEATLNWIDVKFDASDDVPVISIWVTNRFDETGWLQTTLDGRVMETWPFTPS
ncbi:DUF1707 domain-containing protein [Nocardioides sp. Bht2]|uniref:DUF1707 SHOCT-like domain-containing protein n=1 Tax=Nocardioides sp. Bht2 TaxID=3392297 RepID=UPI0039B5C62A